MALSGSLDTSSNAFWATDGSRYFVLEWSTTQHTDSNHPYGWSHVSWTFKGGGTSNQWIACKNWQYQVHTFHSGLHSATTRLYRDTVLDTGSINVFHDENGNASFSLGISGYIHNYGAAYERKNSKTETLDQITYYWDININNLDGNQDCTIASFNEYINNKKVNNTPLWNELDGHNWQPYNTLVEIGELTINPQKPYLEIEKVCHIDRTTEIQKSANGRYGFRLTKKDGIEVFVKYKSTGLFFDLKGGQWNNSPYTSLIATYNSNKMKYLVEESGKLIEKTAETSKIAIPIRTGYKFKGWKNSNGEYVFDENGKYNPSLIGTWTTDGRYLLCNDTTVYADWEIQNVAYVNTGNNEWKLATTYVMTDNNEWKPAIMYVKTSDGWKQSVV